MKGFGKEVLIRARGGPIKRNALEISRDREARARSPGARVLKIHSFCFFSHFAKKLPPYL